MGKVSQVRTKLGCIPTKFECFKANERLKSSSTKQPYVLKKRIDAECLHELGDNCIQIPSSSIKDSSNASSSK